MILAPIPQAFGSIEAVPIAVRLIGSLDRTLIEAFTESCSGLMVTGRQTLIISLGDVLAMRDDNLRRFIATLDAYQLAGHIIFVDGNASWAKHFREFGVEFAAAGEGAGRTTRRQVIIAHSLLNGRPSRQGYGRTARAATGSTSGQ
jgi:anti-anti-sigma regulatory factor